MNYKLAKQLKDAGFPYSKKTQVGYFQNGERVPNYYAAQSEGVPLPTLSELIEACGHGFSCLRHLESFLTGENKWIAQSNEAKSRSFTGSTPEEAVTKLWLALKEKND